MIKGWRSKELSDLATFYSGGTPSKANPEFWGGDTPWITVKDMKSLRFSGASFSLTEAGVSCLRVMPPRTIFILVRGMGLFKDLPILLSDRPATCNQDIKALVASKGVDPEFLAYGLLARKSAILRHVDHAGHGTGRLSTDLLASIPLPLPPFREQCKIAGILRTWDEAIEKTDSLLDLMKLKSSALCQRIFEAGYAPNGDVLRARDLFIPVSERARPDLPLLAVMQDLGIVRRDELDRRVTMPDGDTSTYKVVRPGDFVISLRSFEGGLEYSEVLGLVSPAYTVLRPTREICADYYRHFFKSRSFIGRLDKMIFGIRDGKQIAFRDFGDMYVPHPRIKDQERQEKVLTTASQLVEVMLRKKRALESQKTALMQKLITGEWRLPC